MSDAVLAFLSQLGCRYGWISTYSSLAAKQQKSERTKSCEKFKWEASSDEISNKCRDGGRDLFLLVLIFNSYFALDRKFYLYLIVNLFPTYINAVFKRIMKSIAVYHILFCSRDRQFTIMPHTSV